jgi:hypothetical protein
MAAVLEGIAASKIADFAGEARAADADVLARSYPSETKRLALLACLAHTAQARARAGSPRSWPTSRRSRPTVATTTSC